MSFTNCLGTYSNLASRLNWVRHARRYVTRQAEQATASFATLGKAGYAARRWGANRRWSAQKHVRGQ